MALAAGGARVRARPVRRPRRGRRHRRLRDVRRASSSTATRQPVPAARAVRQPDLVGLDVNPPAAGRPVRLAVGRLSWRSSVVVLLSIGVDGLRAARHRRHQRHADAVDAARPASAWAARSAARLRPQPWRGARVGRWASASSAWCSADASRELHGPAQRTRPMFMQLLEHGLPGHRLRVARAASCSCCSSSSASSWPASPRRRSSAAGRPTRRPAGSRWSSPRPCRASAGRSQSGVGMPVNVGVFVVLIARRASRIGVAHRRRRPRSRRVTGSLVLASTPPRWSASAWPSVALLRHRAWRHRRS